MLYIDTSNIEEIKKFKELGVISGCTINPKILQSDNNKNIEQTILDATKILGNLPIHVELTRTSEMDKHLVEEAIKYFELSNNVVIKIPMWGDGRGLRIAKQLKVIGIQTNITCCMTMGQIVLAGLIRSDYASLFYNRMVDYYHSEGLSKIEAYDITEQTILDSQNYLLRNNLPTKIIVGSIRRQEDIISALNNGANIVTVTPKILSKMIQHPKTDETIVEFDNAWAKLTTPEKLYPIHNHLLTELCTEKCPNFRGKYT